MQEKRKLLSRFFGSGNETTPTNIGNNNEGNEEDQEGEEEEEDGADEEEDIDL